MSSICQLCLKNPATAHLAEIGEDGSGVEELHICSSCSTKLHLDLPNNPPKINHILEMYAHSEESAPSQSADSPVSIDPESDDPSEEADDCCEVCGISYEQFNKNNRFGCAHDYDAFEDSLCVLFNELHGAQQHIGRSPSSSDQRSQQLADRLRLEKRLQDVISEERFEEAARIRDQLKNMDD